MVPMPIELRYRCDVSKLPPELRGCVVELASDRLTEDFIARAERGRRDGLRHWAFRRLRRLVSDYEAYGLLGLYRMHLLSTAQWCTLLQRPWPPRPRGTLLDVGAGRGDVTRALLPLFERCQAIEPARSLRRELARLPVAVMPWDLCRSPVPDSQRYDVITCLNVIDRVAHPKSLLRHARAALVEGGQLVVAVPLPLRPHVDRGRVTVDQEEPLPEADDDWESSVTALVRHLFVPLGLRVMRLARAPYLSQGNRQRPLQALDDALFVCTAGTQESAWR